MFATTGEAREWLRALVGTEVGVNDASLVRLGAVAVRGSCALWDRYDQARQLLDGAAAGTPSQGDR